MKKFAILMLFVAISVGLNAQPCIPGNYTTPGFYPDTITNLPLAQALTPYNTTITGVVLTDTVISGFTVPIDSIGIINITGLPTGFTYTSNSLSNYWHGGAIGCILISGTPTMGQIGIYHIVGDLIVYASGMTVPFSKTGYKIEVTTPDTVTTAGNNGPLCSGSLLSLSASTVIGASYSWTGPNGFTSTQQNPVVSNSATTAMDGVYTVTAYGIGVTTSISTTDVIITQTPAEPVAGSNGPVCYGSPLNLTAATLSGVTYSWTGPNGFTSTQQNPTVSNNATQGISGTYNVTANVNGCTNSSSTIVSVTSLPLGESICFVEFDTLTSKNSINWSSNLSANIDSVNIFNEVSTNVWNLIGTVSASQSNFVDINSNPFNQSYSYRISVKDTCGHLTGTSTKHTTVTLLATYDQGTNTYGFTWSPYHGLAIANYYIYGITVGGTETLIGTVLGNQYFFNYTNPNLSFVKYFVGFNTPACTNKTDYLVKSNYVQAATGIDAEKALNNFVAFYPNPVTNILQIQTSLQIKNIEITDITGRLLYTTSTKTIDCSGFANGVYLINVTTDKGKVQNKFVKE